MKNLYYVIKCFLGFHAYKPEKVMDHFYDSVEDFNQCIHCDNWGFK